MDSPERRRPSLSLPRPSLSLPIAAVANDVYDDGYLTAMCEQWGVKPAVLGQEARDAQDAEALAEASHPPLAGMPQPAVSIEVLQQVEAAQSDADCAEARELLRDALKEDDLYSRYRELCDDGTLRRFLTARQNDVQKARKLVLGYLEWRDTRLPDCFDFRDLEPEARYGGLRVPGLDRHGRPVIVFDYTAGLSAQQVRECQVRNCSGMEELSVEKQMNFLAWTLEHAVRRMENTSIEKYVVFLHVSDFSIASTPPWALIQETLNMLGTCYPERVGNVVLHGVGYFFSNLFNMVKPFIDPRTLKKFIFVQGDDSPGTRNDATLREVIGARWRELTGVGMPRESKGSSPGYNHRRDWGRMLSYELAWHRRDEVRTPGLRSRSAASVSPRRRSRQNFSIIKKSKSQSLCSRLLSHLSIVVFFILRYLYWFVRPLWRLTWYLANGVKRKYSGEELADVMLEEEEEDVAEAKMLDAPVSHDTNVIDMHLEVDPELQKLKELAKEMLNRDRLSSVDRRATSLDAALRFVDAIARGLQSAGLLQRVQAHPPAAGKDGPTIELTTREPAVGEIATRSRVPMDVCVPNRTVNFALSLRPPSQACPFRCACHARCVGFVPTELDDWAELVLDVGEERQGLQAMTPVVINEDVDLKALDDVEVAYFDAHAAIRAANGTGRVDEDSPNMCIGPRSFFNTIERVRGRVALTQYGGRLASKQKIINAAHASGAVAIIGYHVSDRGNPALERALFSDPIPMIVISRENGLRLVQSLRSRSHVKCRGLRKATADHDTARRRRLADRRRALNEEVWLHINGLVGRPVEGDNLLWEAVSGDPTRYAPEDLWALWQRSKHQEGWLTSYKWARMIESISAMARFFPQAQVHKGLGNILILGKLVCDHDIAWLRFQPIVESQDVENEGKPPGQIGVYGGLRACTESATKEQLDRAKAHSYHGSLLCHANGFASVKRASPSTAAFLQCFRGEAAGVPPADFQDLLKVFTAARGPVCAPAGAPWQRIDRTWQVTDQRNALGRVIAKQGRLLWESESDKNARVSGEKSAIAPRRDCGFWGCGF